jgi:hypothetical protein
MGHEDHKAQTEKELLNANPGLQQLMQLYNFSNKFGRGYTDMPDLFLIDWYYSDAVYAPLYYGYGGPGQYAERRLIARSFDSEAVSLMPDMVLVLMKTSPETIRERVIKGESPFPGRHADTFFDPKDTETVLDAFEEQFQQSLFRKKFVLDTTHATVEESLEEFKQQIQTHITPTDRLRVLTHRTLSED